MGSLMWNELSFQAELRLIPLLSGGCLLIVTVSNLAFDDGPTMTLTRIAKAQGLLAAAISLVVGCAALIAWVELAKRRLGGRDLG